MLLRLFDRQAIEADSRTVQFSTPLPDLEACVRTGGPDGVGMQMVGPDGALDRSEPGTAWARRRTTIRSTSAVQQAMLAVVHELVGRYGTHPSLAGLAIELSADGYAQLPGVTWGLDDRTIERFQLDTAQFRCPAEGRTIRDGTRRNGPLVAGPRGGSGSIGEPACCRNSIVRLQ